MAFSLPMSGSPLSEAAVGGDSPRWRAALCDRTRDSNDNESEIKTPASETRDDGGPRCALRTSAVHLQECCPHTGAGTGRRDASAGHILKLLWKRRGTPKKPVTTRPQRGKQESAFIGSLLPRDLGEGLAVSKEPKC